MLKEVGLEVKVEEEFSDDVEKNYITKQEVAEGEKCERCWKYSTEVGENPDHPTLCHRCAEAIS